MQRLERAPRDHAQQDNGTLLSNQTHARMRDETKRQQCSAATLSTTARHYTSTFTHKTKQRLGMIDRRSVALATTTTLRLESTQTPSRQRRDCRSPFVKLRSNSSRHKKTTRPTRARIESSVFACALVILPCSLSPTDARPLAQQTKQHTQNDNDARQQPDRVRDTIKKKSTFFDLCRGTSIQQTKRHHPTI